MLPPGTMKLYGENIPKLESLESAEVVLVHCNLVKKDYQHTSKVLFTFVSNKYFGQLSLD